MYAWCFLTLLIASVCVVMLAQMQYSFFSSQHKCVFDLVIIKQCTKGVCVHRWHGLDFLQNILGQPDEQMNHVASPQTADHWLQPILHMCPKHLDPSLLTKIWQLLFSWNYGIAFCGPSFVHTHQSMSLSKISASHWAGVQECAVCIGLNPGRASNF